MKEDQLLTEVSEAEANAEFIRQKFAEFKKGNTQAIIDACTDESTWKLYENPAVPFAGTHKGKEALKRYFRLLSENVTFNSYEQKDYIAQGDTVVVLSNQELTIKKTGKSVNQDVCQVFKLRNGKIVSQTIFNDTRLVEKAFS